MSEQATRPDLIAVGQALKRARADRGWTLEQAAAESGVSRRTVLNAEAGRHALTIDNLLDLAAALGVRASVLIAVAEIDDSNEDGAN